MGTPNFLVENLYSFTQFPNHVFTPSEEAVGHEMYRLANGRRSIFDNWQATTTNTEQTLKVQCDTLRGANTIFLDRGHNLTDKTIAYEHSANGSSWTTAWTFAPTGYGTDLTSHNFLLQSQAIATSPWGTSNATATNNVTTAPDGTLTATGLVPSVTGAVNHYARQSLTISANEKLSASIYVKANGYTCLRLTVADVEAATNSFRVDLDLVTGATSGLTSTGAGTVNNVVVASYGNGWYRIQLNGAVNNSATTAWVLPLVYPNIAGAGSTYAGDGTSGVYLWGAQLERNGTVIAAPRGYVRTTALAAAGAMTEDGAWGYTFTAASNLYHRIRIPAMGVGLVPSIVGLWLGSSYAPAYLDLPFDEDQDDLAIEEFVSPTGWRGNGIAVPVRGGQLQFRLDTIAEYTIARYHLRQLYGRRRPMWITYDNTQADRSFLAIRPAQHLSIGFEAGHFPRRATIPYVEHEPALP